MQVPAFTSNKGWSEVQWQWERIWSEGCWVAADRAAVSQCCDVKTFYSALMRARTWRLISQSAECIIGRTHSLIEATLGFLKERLNNYQSVQPLTNSKNKEPSVHLLYRQQLLFTANKEHHVYIRLTDKQLITYNSLVTLFRAEAASRFFLISKQEKRWPTSCSLLLCTYITLSGTSHN